MHPEEVEAQLQNCGKVNQVRWGAQHEGLGLTKAELEEMDHHECQQCDAREGQVQLARGHCVVDANVPGPLQCYKHVQQSSKKDVLLDNVCLQARSLSSTIAHRSSHNR